MSVLDRPELQDVVFFGAPLIGALLGARYAQGRTRRECMTAYVVSYGAGLFVGSGMGEYLGLGYMATGAVMFTIGAGGQEVMAYVIAALREGAKDPASTFRKWIDAILGRRPAEDWQQKPAAVAAPLVHPSPLLPSDSQDRRP